MKMRLLLYVILTIFLLPAIFCRCASQHDSGLRRIAETVDSLPQAALDSLAAIDTSRLSIADKYFHILLTAKARDKAWVMHSSDSMIIEAVNYYENDKENPLYPEALFYAGRAYSDIGDFPSALDYFQQALEFLPDTPGNLHFRGLICGHISWVLDQMKLHSLAIRYIKESLRIDSIENIGFNLAIDWQHLSECYIGIDSIRDAELSLKNAMKFADSLQPEDRASLQLAMAKIKFSQDSILSALNLLRGLQDKVFADERNLALKYLAESYLKSDIRDSALIYAKELAWSSREENRKDGFRMLLSDSLISYIPVDSLMFYVSAYRNAINRYQRKYDGEQAVIQTSIYNYNVHDRLRDKAEQRSDTLMFWLEVSAFAIMLCLIAILSLLLYLRSRKLKYYRLLTEIDSLKSRLSQAEYAVKTDDRDAIRNELREKVLQLTNHGRTKSEVKPSILKSEAYSRLAALIRENDAIENPIDKKDLAEDNPLWKELEAAVHEDDPEFFNTLERLAGCSLNKQEKMTIIIIRCGVTPTQMSYLFRRKKGSISSRREQLGVRLFGGNLKAQEIDNIIRGL